MNDANKDVLIETLKRKIKALENENKELREKMKKAYAQIYEKF
jgi:chaperonin cofactor prefoldin